jgi:hypothetical protein
VTKLSDQIITDLSRKCSQDVAQRINMTTQLCDDPADMMMIAISACATSLGAASGFVSSLVRQATGEDASPDALVDGLWEMLRPMALKAVGGSDADFRSMLEKCRG